MSTAAIVTILVILAVAAAGLIWWDMYSKRRSEQLKAKFGPQYDRAISETGSTRRAEAKLDGLEKRVKSYSIRPLSPTDRQRFVQSWRIVQATFVDDPGGALAQADQLLREVMIVRGYPLRDFDARAEELSVDHPFVVEHYRIGHKIALDHVRGAATTEDLRQAMIHYRALFDELVGESEITRFAVAGAA